MDELTGTSRRYLQGLANSLESVVYVGKNGLTDALVTAVEQALDSHELIKVKFNDHKDEKDEIATGIAQRAGCHLVGLIGHVAIFYREHPEQDKRKILLPER